MIGIEPQTPMYHACRTADMTWKKRTHPRQFGRGQSRVEAVGLEEDAGQASVGHGAIGHVLLHTTHTRQTATT